MVFTWVIVNSGHYKEVSDLVVFERDACRVPEFSVHSIPFKRASTLMKDDGIIIGSGSCPEGALMPN
jgi:hypothetical protein